MLRVILAAIAGVVVGGVAVKTATRPRYIPNDDNAPLDMHRPSIFPRWSDELGDAAPLSNSYSRRRKLRRNSYFGS